MITRRLTSLLLLTTALSAPTLAHGADQPAPPASTRPPVAAKYRNSADASQTWTGRGKRPRWLADAIAAGSALDSFLI